MFLSYLCRYALKQPLHLTFIRKYNNGREREKGIITRRVTESNPSCNSIKEMSKRQRISRALFQRNDACGRCADEKRKVVKCACDKIYCEGCLREVINEWVIFQDQMNPYSPLITPSQLGEGYEDLPDVVINDLRYHHLFTRIRECSNCFQRTLCPHCSVFGYYQRCELCRQFRGLSPRDVPRYSNVCPKCISEDVLVSSLGIPPFEMFNPFLGNDTVEKLRPVILFDADTDSDNKEEGSDELKVRVQDPSVGSSSTSSTSSTSSSSTSLLPMLLWRCKYHLSSHEGDIDIDTFKLEG